MLSRDHILPAKRIARAVTKKQILAIRQSANPQSERLAFELRKGIHQLILRSVSDVTRILQAAQQGDPKAAEDLLPLVYDELRKLAAAKMTNEAAGQTLQPTALVHEAWLRLVGSGQPQEWNGRGHFFGAAAEAMRRILVERARHKARLKHGGELKRVELDNLDLASASADEAILAVSEALDKLAARDAAGAELIKLRFFVGLSQTEAAEVLGLPERSAGRVWAFARAWLHEELQKTL